jgi:hypothetical protein
MTIQQSMTGDTGLRECAIKQGVSRRIGYLVAILINAVLLYAINVWPGWATVPFVTADLVAVLGLVNASLWVSVVANAVYLVDDRRWLKMLGNIATTAVGLVALMAMWQVFPFDLAVEPIDWVTVARTVLIISMIGSAIAIVVNLVGLVRAIAFAQTEIDPSDQMRPVARNRS